MKEKYDAVQAITEVVRTMMDKAMDKVLNTNPIIVEKHHAGKPLYAALVPDEIFKGSRFGRCFVTDFDTVWGQFVVAVANAFHGNCQCGYTIFLISFSNISLMTEVTYVRLSASVLYWIDLENPPS